MCTYEKSTIFGIDELIGWNEVHVMAELVVAPGDVLLTSQVTWCSFGRQVIYVILR